MPVVCIHLKSVNCCVQTHVRTCQACASARIDLDVCDNQQYQIAELNVMLLVVDLQSGPNTVARHHGICGRIVS